MNLFDYRQMKKGPVQCFDPVTAITAGIGIAGGINKIRSANEATNFSNDMARAQLGLQQEQFDWQKQQQDLLNRIRQQSSTNYWNEYSSTPTLSVGESQSMAENQLTPLYDEEMKNTLNTVNTANMARGFYGQLPGDVLANEAAAKVSAAKASGVSSLANQLYNQSQQNKLAKLQSGLSAFGTYGNIS